MLFTYSYIPKYVPKDLPWYEKDGVMTWLDQAKCVEMLFDIDKHFATTHVINFDIIHRLARVEKVPDEIYKNIQTIDSDELKMYPSYNQRQVLGSVFRSKGKDVLVDKELLHTHFKDQQKQVFLISMKKIKFKKSMVI